MWIEICGLLEKELLNRREHKCSSSRDENDENVLKLIVVIVALLCEYTIPSPPLKCIFKCMKFMVYLNEAATWTTIRVLKVFSIHLGKTLPFLMLSLEVFCCVVVVTIANQINYVQLDPDTVKYNNHYEY